METGGVGTKDGSTKIFQLHMASVPSSSDVERIGMKHFILIERPDRPAGTPSGRIHARGNVLKHTC